MAHQHELADSPSDIISSVAFSPSGDRILIGSWDQTIYIYAHTPQQDGPAYSLQHQISCEAPILDVCWNADGSEIFWVGLDQDVRRISLQNETPDDEQKILSSHEEASNKIALNKEHNLLLSTSWDGTLHAHDVQSELFIRIRLVAKPFALSLTNDRAVVAMAERKVAVYDLMALKQLISQTGSTSSGQTIHELQPWQERESSLKFMTRDVVCMPDGSGFATSSIEGRVGVEWFDPEYNNENKYAFKCHRQTSTTTVTDPGTGETKEESVDVVYPVSALAFHPIHGTFATGGGDGVVALWDAKTKRRVRQYQKLGASVAAMDFSPDGKFLAIGVSPGFEDGFEDEEIDASLVKVIVRELAEGEAKGKAAK